MTTWHKRLLIFISKILAGLIIFGIIGLLLFYNYYYKQDRLIKLVPKEAAIYISLRLNSEILVNTLADKAIRDLGLQGSDLNELNSLTSYNAALAAIPKPGEFGFDYLVILDLKPGVQGLEKYYARFKENNLNYEILTKSPYESNLLVISNSVKLIEQVKKIRLQEEPSLAEKVSAMINLKSLSSNYQGKIYLDSQSLINNLAQNKDFKLNLILAAIKAKNPQELYLGLKLDNNKLMVETKEASKNEDLNKPLLEKLPLSTGLSLNFSQADQEFEEVLNALSGLDPAYYTQISQNIAQSEKIYNYNFKTDLLNLFSGQTQFILNNDNTWILALQLPQNQDNFAEITKIEQILQEYIAYNNPLEKEKMMPDYTYIRQLVKDRENINWQTENVSNFSLKYLEYNNNQFAYYINDENTLILANNKENLSNLINNTNIVANATFSQCNLANLDESIIFNSNLIQDLFNISQYISKIQLTSDSDNNICLCFEK